MNHSRSSVLFPLTLFFLVFMTSPGFAAQKWELSLSAAPWTAWPFTTIIEKESRSIIEYKLDKLLEFAAPVIYFQSDHERIAFESNGLALSLTLARQLGNTPWSISIEGSALHLDLPYTLDYAQRLEASGITIAQVNTLASGLARIRSFDGALGIHYRFFKRAKFHAKAAAGLHFMAMRGDISIRGESLLTTLLGDATVPFNETETMAELRSEGLDIPKLLVYPSVSLSAGWNFWKSMGLSSRLTFSQGLFLSIGLSVVF